MFKAFIIGFIQGICLTALFSMLNLGFFGSAFFALDIILHGISAFYGIIFVLLINIAYYYFISKHAIKNNPQIFIFGIIIAIILGIY
jgi:hypothetical protein